MAHQAIGPKNNACSVCGQSKPAHEMLHGEVVHGSITEIILKSKPEWSPQQPVCFSCLNHFRGSYVENMLEAEKGELSQLDKQVVQSIREQEILSKNIDAEFDTELSFADRLADQVASFGGSWKFILFFFTVMFVWIGINAGAYLIKPFDPFPFILLNLVLSCLAALQAPVIMMSQNRLETKDRKRAEHDYRVNLKAELEIRHLNAKMDQLLTHQWKRLMEIQKIQLELMEKMADISRENE